MYCVEGLSEREEWLSCREVNSWQTSQYPYHKYRGLPPGEYLVKAFLVGGKIAEPQTLVILEDDGWLLRGR